MASALVVSIQKNVKVMTMRIFARRTISGDRALCAAQDKQKLQTSVA
jgi:hypothetical protein